MLVVIRMIVNQVVKIKVLYLVGMVHALPMEQIVQMQVVANSIGLPTVLPIVMLHGWISV